MGGQLQVTWKLRQQMVKRGARMLEAHWRNRCDLEHLHAWFTRTLPRYAAFGHSRSGKATNLKQLERKFWDDCEVKIHKDRLDIFVDGQWV